MNDIEEWRPIPGWPYEASSLGRIRRIGRWPLKPRDNGHGYKVVTLCRRDKRRDFYVHRLVCTAFHGPPPSPGDDTDHYPDRSRSNNTATNLRWLDPSNNRSTRLFACGENNGMSKLTAAQVSNMRLLRSQGVPATRLATMFGISRSQAFDICRGKHWRTA